MFSFAATAQLCSDKSQPPPNSIGSPDIHVCPFGVAVDLKEQTIIKVMFYREQGIKR